MAYIKIIVVYSFVLVILHIIPIESGPALDQMAIGPLRADYLTHTLIFLPWMVLVWLHFKARQIDNGKRPMLILYWLIGGLLLASFSEGIQLFLPYRAFNPLDLIFNLAGVLLGTLIFLRK